MEEYLTEQKTFMSAASSFSPHPVSRKRRVAMCLDGQKLYVVICGDLPVLLSQLMCRENVQIYTVQKGAELKKMLMDENGIPADLAIVEGHVMAGLPQMSFFSPSGDHECVVIFSSDPLSGDNERTSEIYTLIDEMLDQKQKTVKKVRGFFTEKEPRNCEDSHENRQENRRQI